ncbi:PAS domain-containing protein [Uliginosibacterium sp. H3]|uniref:histidine kinase n=1 Tax=Uliginosibacterium silvisoli TaxID=3114758 RepID=A0ABU6K9E9_9RHOO|nr:PAS domain-containing protein [Uliginosibacterium sp. H3]
MSHVDSLRALIFAPMGRDARLAAQILHEADIAAMICDDVDNLVDELERGAGLAVVTEDALAGRDFGRLYDWIGQQPFWSDLPFLLLTLHGGGVERNPTAQRLTETLGNVSFLERPFHPTTFVSVARTATRSRLRQYKARDDQLAISDSETRLRFALEAGRLGSWQFAVNTQTLTCSDICKSNYGRGAHEAFSYADLLDCIHPDDQAQMIEAVQAAIEGKGDYQIEYRNIWPDGSVHSVEVRGRKLIAANGDVTLLGVSTDVTERRQAESDLRASEARYRSLTEVLPQLVWTCLADGRCNYLSTQWVDYTGAPREQQLGLDWLDRAIHPDDRARTLEHWMGAVADLHPYDIEFRIRRHDGVYHWFKVRGIPLRGARREILSWFGTCTDIQDIVEAREIMKRSSDELADLVAQRTLALEAAMAERQQVEEVLRQSQKMEAVGQLTGGLAHDFNNLIQVISGGLEIIRLGDRVPNREKILDGMRRAADRASQLTRQLLAFSRKQTLKPEQLALESQVTAMRELLDRSLRGDIRVETHFDEGLWPVEADPTQLELAIINIAVNARDAMPRGGTLSISARNEMRLLAHGEEGAFVRLSISDTGTGMDAATLARIFEPFYTTKDVGKGSGLGLPQVYGFAQQSGGDVLVESTPGQGSTVSLLLPRSNGALIAAIQPIPEPIAVEVTSVRRSVLLVEDDDEVAALTAEMLAQLGHHATRVSDAAAALGALASNRAIDVVFTDVMMPGGMSGAELACEIRKRRPELAVILTTGYDGDAVAAASAQDLPLLRKPFRLDALSSALELATHI